MWLRNVPVLWSWVLCPRYLTMGSLVFECPPVAKIFKNVLKHLILQNKIPLCTESLKKQTCLKVSKMTKKELVTKFLKGTTEEKIQICVSRVLKDKFLLFAGTPEAPCVWTHPTAQIQTVKRKPFPNSGTYGLASAEFMFSWKGKKKKFPGLVFAKQTFHLWSKCKQMKLSFSLSETPGRLQHKGSCPPDCSTWKYEFTCDLVEKVLQRACAINNCHWQQNMSSDISQNKSLKECLGYLSVWRNYKPVIGYIGASKHSFGGANLF